MSSSKAHHDGFVPAKRTKYREIPDFPSMFRATFPDSRQFNIRAPDSKVIRTRLLMLVSPDAHASMKGRFIAMALIAMIFNRKMTIR